MVKNESTSNLAVRCAKTIVHKEAEENHHFLFLPHRRASTCGYRKSLDKSIVFVCIVSNSSPIDRQVSDRISHRLAATMNAEKLKKLQSQVAQVRIGGKGTPRRKKKVVHSTQATDDKKLQSSLKKLSVNTIPGIEEVSNYIFPKHVHLGCQISMKIYKAK